MTVLLDASAVLAFLLDEDGAPVVDAALLDGAVCSAANWSEVAQKLRAADRNWSLSEALLDSYGATAGRWPAHAQPRARKLRAFAIRIP